MVPCVSPSMPRWMAREIVKTAFHLIFPPEWTRRICASWIRHALRSQTVIGAPRITAFTVPTPIPLPRGRMSNGFVRSPRSRCCSKVY